MDTLPPPFDCSYSRVLDQMAQAGYGGKFSDSAAFHRFISNPSWVPQKGAAVTPGDACFSAACLAVPAIAGGFSEAFHPIRKKPRGQTTHIKQAFGSDPLSCKTVMK